MDKKVKFKDIPFYSVNPFLDALRDRLEARCTNLKNTEQAENLRTGDIIEYSSFNGNKAFDWKDKAPFIKIFNDMDNYKDMANLSKSANYLFWLISSKLKPNADVVQLRMIEYMDYAKTTNRGQYYIAAAELIDKLFIVKIGSDSFYINPTRFFNGKRERLAGDAQDFYIKRNR